MIPTLLRAAPHVVLVALFLWAGRDLIALSAAPASVGLQTLLAIAALLFLIGHTRRGAVAIVFGYLPLGGAYYGAHLAELGLEILPAVAFLTLVVVQIELRTLSERFGPLYVRALVAESRRKIDAAFRRAALRLLVAALLSILIPLFAADLARFGLVPTTSISSALLLAAGLVVVIALLSLLPVLGRPRGSRESALSEFTQKAN